MKRIDDGGIVERLERIRAEIGARKISYVRRPPHADIDEDMPADRLEQLLHESGLLIYKGNPTFAYIRDHTVRRHAQSFDSPVRRNKIHFTVCEKLQEMISEGRSNRYRITNRSDDCYTIDIQEGTRTKTRDVVLYPCKYCLRELNYKCYRDKRSNSEKNLIVEAFTAKEALSLIWQQFEIFRRQVGIGRFQPSSIPSQYPNSWNRVAKYMKKRCDYTCDKCHVRLNGQPYLLDVHHIDSDKQNIRDDNLCCLCKLCHHEEHPHYYVSESDRRKIVAARSSRV